MTSNIQLINKIFFSLLILNVFFLQTAYNQPINPWTPPEYFPSKAVLIEWDFNQNIWNLYSELIKECSDAAPVILVVRDQGEENQMTQQLINDGVAMGNISFVHVPCERMWIRDHGPLAVNSDHGVVFIDLDDLANSGLDEQLPTNLANIWGLDSYELQYVLCGGNFMVDSYNTLYTTTRLYTNNPNSSQVDIDQDLATYMGITNIITFSPQHNDYWGHIDMQIKLLNDTTFVISSVDQGSGPNYDSLELNYSRLASLIAPNGKPYHITRLPMADNWKTYVNSLILNDKVIVPVYNNPKDTIAINTYQQLLPNHNIVGINCNQIIGWEGAIHCITMQLFDDAQVTSINSISVKNKIFEIYPNPAICGQKINILISNEITGNTIISIYDISGKLLFTTFSENGKSIAINWNWPSGQYLIEVKTSESSYSKKITGM